MDLALLAARLLLAGVFVVAGLAKLADRTGSQKAMRDFGVPDPLAVSFGNALPLAELVVAAALIPNVSAWWGALGALALLLAFVGGIALNMARGRAPECHCFGQLHSSPAGWRTLLRNLGLGAVAAFVLIAGPTSPGADLLGAVATLAREQGLLLAAGAVVVVLAIANGWALFGVLQQQGRLMRRVQLLEAQFLSGVSLTRAEGLPVGTPAPSFTLPDLEGRAVSLADLLAAGRHLLLTFVDPDCGPCVALLPYLARWQREHADRFRVVAISRGDVEANRGRAREHGLQDVLIQHDREVDDLFLVDGTPSAVLVRADGTIGSPHAGGGEQIESLVGGLTGLLGEGPLTASAAPHSHEEPTSRADQGTHAELESASSA